MGASGCGEIFIRHVISEDIAWQPFSSPAEYENLIQTLYRTVLSELHPRQKSPADFQ
jgi:hypothetical protein